MRESFVEKKLRLSTESFRGVAIKFTSPGLNGVPDRIVILPKGKICFVELKAPRRKPSKMQRYVLRKLYRLGARVAVVDNVVTAKRLIERLAL